MSELALQLIRKAKETQATFLDLGNCGLTELPEELFELECLKGLNLGKAYNGIDGKYHNTSQTPGYENRLKPTQLKFLRRFIGLEQLYIRAVVLDNQNISFLSDFSSLKVLDLSQNRLTHISFLGDLKDLQILNLNNNQISDLNGLQSLNNLRKLYLNGNRVSKITPLNKAHSLEVLDMGGNKVSNFSELENLTNLQELRLNNNQITDFIAFQNLINLQILDLNENRIPDLSTLQGLNNLQELKLSYNGIGEAIIPKGLTQLQTLNLGANQIVEITIPEDLISLQRLILGMNKIQTISIPPLKNLQELDLAANQIKNITIAENLTKLKTILLWQNQLKEIHFPRDLVNLQELQLHNNQINNISSIENLTNLQVLDLGYNDIVHTSPLKKLASLKNLNLRDNPFTDVSFLRDLTNLEKLDLGYNGISDISPLQGLTNLQELSLFDNGIKELTVLGNLSKLQKLDIRNNGLQKIPPQLATLSKLTTLDLDQNPLEVPPIEVCFGGIDNIRSWFLSKEIIKQETDGRWVLVEAEVEIEMIPLYETKIVLVGNGEVGKTSIARKLKDRDAPLPGPEERTDLEVYRIKKEIRNPEKNDEIVNFSFNIWDFGGQGKYRTVQQFFCSRNTLYLYITSPDDEERNLGGIYQGFTYWLNMVRAFSFDAISEHYSPVIHVQNKVDLKKLIPVNEAALHKHYPQIYPVTIRTSCTTLEGLDQLEKVIEEVLPEVSHDIFIRKYSPAWLAVKEGLENHQNPHISYAEYQQLAQDKGLSDIEAESWLDILDRIGTVIYFGNIEDLKDFVVLDPNWVREGAFAILRSKEIEGRYGEFNALDFPRIWQDFKAEEYPKLIALMLAFELCYQIKDAFGNPLYLTPALFPEVPPLYQFQELVGSQHSVFQLRFRLDPFFPAGLLHRLIVRKNHWVYQRLWWRKGVVFHHQDTYAEITEDWEEKVLNVKIAGSNPEQFFMQLQNEVMTIIDNFKRAKMVAQLEMITEGYHKDEWENMSKLVRFDINFWRKLIQKPLHKPTLKIFISYAHAYTDYYKVFYGDFRSYTKNLPFAEIEIFTDEHIPLGSDWHAQIQEAAKKCDVAILLVSERFMTSEYIKEHEMTLFVKRMQDEGLLVVPIYFFPCRFYDWEILKKTQFFKPSGVIYGKPEIDADGFCYADLIEFSKSTGLLIPNPNRGRYMIDFINNLEPELKKLVDKKGN